MLTSVSMCYIEGAARKDTLGILNFQFLCNARQYFQHLLRIRGVIFKKYILSYFIIFKFNY